MSRAALCPQPPYQPHAGLKSIYVCPVLYLQVLVCVYVYMEREREREMKREGYIRYKHVWHAVQMHTYGVARRNMSQCHNAYIRAYIYDVFRSYIYIYIHYILDIIHYSIIHIRYKISYNPWQDHLRRRKKTYIYIYTYLIDQPVADKEVRGGGTHGLTRIHMDSRGLERTHADSHGLTLIITDSRGLTRTQTDSRGLKGTHTDNQPIHYQSIIFSIEFVISLSNSFSIVRSAH